ncbi:adenine nucleotide transporter [Sparassis latifolia]|uniref:Peroxisomal adenine nucleotide transporter 1 n=1 Tax=Sparassis crispa TaxID=139825 RepID=A0A401H0D9_9APHY|nr:Peroxisomal adenine nucleotide transporter 1 [Sparassis crispa]GBE87897.1 Peroxisomal adenine nucleotide transporter 1 [Sparassis crispa]
MSSKPTQLTPFGYALAGALGGCFSNAVVYPLDIVKTRIQASTDGRKDDNEKLGVISALLRIYKEEGFSGYYSGFAATMLNTFSMQYAYFFFYSIVRTSYIKRVAARSPKGSKAPALSTAAELILGAIAGALAQIFTIPVAVIATRQQIGHSLDRPRKRRASSVVTAAKATNGDVEKANGDSEKANEDAKKANGNTKADKKDADEQDTYDDSFLGVAREIVEEEGVSGLWLGIRPGLVLTVNPAITYGVYERVKGTLLLAQESASGKAGAKLNPWTAFVVGALSKTLATVVTYPYIMAKVRIQARSADFEEAVVEHQPPPHQHEYHHKNITHHPGALEILGRVWRKEGFLGWYKGMGAQITKAVISQALLFVSKEKFEHWALMIMVLFYKLRQAP